MSLGPLNYVVLFFSVGVCPAFAQLHFHGSICEGGKGGEGSSVAEFAEAPLTATITKPTVVSRTSWGCPDGQTSGWTPQMGQNVFDRCMSGDPGSETSYEKVGHVWCWKQKRPGPRVCE